MKKHRRGKSLFSASHFKIVIVAILLLLCISGFTLYKFVIFQTKTVVETSRNEMRKIPSDVKKELIKEVSNATSSASFRVPILMYHYVEYVQDKKDTIRQALDVNPNTFEQQVKTLLSAGFTFMTARELGDVIDGKSQLPKNPILLTFDDGHWDLDTVVLPILKKYNVKATAYIISGFIGKPDFMSQQQLQEVINSGLIDVGAHTIHHVSLKGKLSSTVKSEVDQSKAMLENNYHISVVSFAYPDGAFDQQAINIVKEAGFSTATSTIPGIEQSKENRFFLYRIRPGYKTGQILLNYLQQDKFRPY